MKNLIPLVSVEYRMSGPGLVEVLSVRGLARVDAPFPLRFTGLECWNQFQEFLWVIARGLRGHAPEPDIASPGFGKGRGLPAPPLGQVMRFEIGGVGVKH